MEENNEKNEFSEFELPQNENQNPELVLDEDIESETDYDSFIPHATEEVKVNTVEVNAQTEYLNPEDNADYTTDPEDKKDEELYEQAITDAVSETENQNGSEENEQDLYSNSDFASVGMKSFGEDDIDADENLDFQPAPQYPDTPETEQEYEEQEVEEEYEEDEDDDDYIEENEEDAEESNYDEEIDLSQEEQIDNSEPSKKESASEHENNARFLNRNKIIMVIAGAFVGMLIFFSFIMPMFKDASGGKKKQKERTFDKSPSVQVPKEVTDIPDQVITIPEQQQNNMENVYDDYYRDYEDLSSKFPDPAEPTTTQQTAYSYSYPQGYSYDTQEEDSNADELQKAFQDVPLQDQDITKIKNILAEEAQNKYSQLQAAIDSSTYRHYTPATEQSGDVTDALLLNMLANAAEGDVVDTYKRLNDQAGKQSFRNSNAGSGGAYSYTANNTLWKGTIIPAVLDTAICTDLPGIIKAHVTQNIYSSNDGRYLLIPQGSILIAEYNSSVSYAQDRVQVAWNTLIRPDGLEVNLGSMDGVDTEGHTGYKGKRSEHLFELAKGLGLIAAYSLITTKVEMMYASRNLGNHYVDNLKDSLTGPISGYAQDKIDNLLDIQPTINLASGTEINIITNVTMELPPLTKPAPTKKVKVRNH